MDLGTHVQVRILGPIQVIGDDGEQALSPQLRRLLGLLAVANGGYVSADAIAEYIADGDLHGSKLRTAISRLRKVLGDRIETVAGGYRLKLAEHEFDAALFESLRDRARIAPVSERVGVISEALGLWRGPAFAEVADLEWAAPAAAKLDSARAALTEDLAEALNGVGRFDEAIELLDTHLVANPYRERPVALLMRALAGSGRLADALKAYHRFRVTLRDDTGLDPSSELRSLEGELLADAGGNTRAVDEPATRALPGGTVTFLFTDIEGSTERWQRDETLMSDELAEHDRVLREVVTTHHGIVFKHTGDGLCAVFTSAPAAADAAIEIHRAVSLPLRVGIHIGEAELRDGDYFGPTLNRTARVMDAGHGGQTLVSAPVAALLDGHELVDHGRHRLKGLTTPEQLFQIGHDTFPPLRTAASRVGNLPDELTSFIGRQRELVSLVDLVAEHRVVTLIGVGGTGKTRLSIETATALSPTFPDGCWLVQLATVTTPEAVPFAFAVSMGIAMPENADVAGLVVEWLRHRRALVIVDNCEHLLASAADIVEQIASECPAVRLLSTSREPLMLNGEHLMPVPMLDQTDAHQLFIDRALAECPDLVIDDAQSAAIDEICARLDGLPLAIELAASRVRAFGPGELATMLDQRFRLLVGGRRSRMERHQTMRGTLDWSYDLCTPHEQQVFDRLSVFQSAFDLTAARAIASSDDVNDFDVIDIVPQLVDRSLLQRTTGSDGTTRYRMLETMRAYGRDHLQAAGVLDQVRHSHARYIAVTVGTGTVASVGTDERRHHERMREYLADSNVALDWLLEHHEWELALHVASLAHMVKGPLTEWLGRIHDALIESGQQPPEHHEIIRCNLRDLHLVSRDELHARARTAMNGGERVPLTRAYLVPEAGFMPTTADEAEEMLSLLPRYDRAPARTRAVAYWAALRGSVLFPAEAQTGGWNPHDLAGFSQALAEFERVVLEANSDHTREFAAELRGSIAMATGNWGEAADLFDLVESFDLSAGVVLLYSKWNAISCRCRAGQMVATTTLIAAWNLLFELDFPILLHRGAAVTATVLDSLGHGQLARRFGQWIHDHDPGRAVELHAAELERAGLSELRPSERPERIDDLLAALHTLATNHD